ncbi:MAG: tRNA (adenosine(37)-N6)-threonylcarbamoyltransferase complex dimerization subunit type 1 TsaB [Pseudomonadota bacterium]
MILAFDATAGECAAALFDGDRLVSEKSETMEKGHAERLFPLVEEMLSDAGLAYANLTAIACVTGPGNFTGARIAVAAARGLALSLKILAVGVDRFEAAADGVSGDALIRLQARGGAVHEARIADGALTGEAETMQPEETSLSIIAPVRTDLRAVAAIARKRLASRDAPRPAPRYLKPANAAPGAAPPPLLP